MIKFEFLQPALQSYRNLLTAVKETGAMGATFDLMVTPYKGEEGKEDSLTLEISRSNAYGFVQIMSGIKVIEGSGESLLISSETFDKLPENTVPDQYIQVEVSDQVYITYPETAQMTDIRFSFEHSSALNTFVRRQASPLQISLDVEGLKNFSRYIKGAAPYTFKKRLDEPMSVINVNINEACVAQVEATTGQEAFCATTQLTGCANLTKEKFSCMNHPAIWLAGVNLGTVQGAGLHIGMDTFNVTFVAGNTVLMHSRVNFLEYPAVCSLIEGWLVEYTHDTFSAKINPDLFHQKMKFLESVGMGAKAQAPSFLMTPKGAQASQKGNLAARFQLKGFAGSGESTLSDANVFDVSWMEGKEATAQIRLPVSVIMQALQTSKEFGLVNFFDISGVPSVFFSDPENGVFVLLSQEETSVE